MCVALCAFLCFYFNMINALSMLFCLSDVNSIYVWRIQSFVKGVRPRQLTCGKGGELKRINQQVKGVRPRPLTCGKGGELKRINQQVKGVRPMPLTCGKGGELKRIIQQVKGV